MPEQQIVVVFDVRADTREDAANLVAEVIGMNSRTTPVGATNENGSIDSWWYPEEDVKAIDGNDNEAMLLLPHDLIDSIDDAYNQGDGAWLETAMRRLRRYLPKRI